MRILVDLTHPAHVHFFRHPISLWRERGHEVFLTSRRKDIAVELLERLGLEHEELGEARRGLSGLLIELGARTAKLLRCIRRFRPDVMTAVGGVWIAQAGWLARVPTVVFYDTENAKLSNLLTYPFCSMIATPHCYEGQVPKKKHRTYAGYHELAYTHPARFQPDPAALREAGLEADPFIFLRLVSWGSAHDVTDHGLTNLSEAVNALKRFGRVVISSERSLPAEIEPLRLKAPPERVHHLLAYARLYFGESATMASESATLGTPAIFVSTSVRGYTNEQEERYGLTYTFSDPRTAQCQALAKATQILSDPQAEETWERKRRQMLADMIDVAAYVVDLVESCARRVPS